MRAVQTVLVVDENGPALEATVRILQSGGCEVAQATDGSAALFELRALRPDLVLLGVALPDASGYQVLRQIRADPALKRVMVVLLSAHPVLPEQQAGGLDAGADGYIVRPIASVELLARVRSYLRQGELIEKLRASEEQFSSAFAHAAVGMALVAPDGRYLRINRALCQMLGYAEAELLARTFQEITHPDDLNDHGNVRQLLAGAIPSFQMEKRYRHGQGHWVVGLLSVSLVRDAEGKPVHQIAQIQDITARTLAEDESRRSATKLRRQAEDLAAEKARLVAAQSVAKVGSWETDLKAGTVSWSDETHRIFETDPAKFQPTHQAFLQLVHPDDRVIVDQAFSGSHSAGEPCAIEHRLLMPDGRVKIVEERWQVSCDEQRKPLRAVGTCQDITDRRQAEQMMRLSEARYRTLFEHAPSGITISDEAGRYLDANASICRMLGCPRNELLHLRRADVVVEDAAAGEPGTQERKLRRKDGSIFDVEILATPMPDGNLLEMIRDITVRKASQHEILRLSRLYAALSHVNQAIVTTRSREDLFTKVCRALVEFGGFRMAWIGWLEPETRRVIPVGQWGDRQNYLSRVEIFADDRPEGHGPVSTAIREGKYSVSNDFSSDPRTRAWREIAAGDGIRAGAAFPIRENGAICGAMTVYSAEVGLFQDKEIGLLKEAAGDVCFGIDHLNRESARQQGEADLRAAEQQLHSLIRRLHTVREEEAKRIARELHDDLGQKLTVLNLELADLERKLPRATPLQFKQIERMRAVVDQTIEVVQKISGELRLGQLDMLGLTAAIDWQLQEFARHAGISCRLTRLDETPNLSDIERTTVFRILQEALTNIARHSGATEVVVSLQVGPDELILTVTDNGRGITAMELSDRKSIGLLGMRERALIIGGDVKITGEGGAGTTVRVRIPLGSAIHSI